MKSKWTEKFSPPSLKPEAWEDEATEEELRTRRKTSWDIHRLERKSLGARQNKERDDLMSSPCCCCCCMFWPAQPPLFLLEIMLVYMLCYGKRIQRIEFFFYFAKTSRVEVLVISFSTPIHTLGTLHLRWWRREKSLWWWWWVIKMVRAQKVKTWEILQCRPGTTLCSFFAIDEIEIEILYLHERVL